MDGENCIRKNFVIRNGYLPIPKLCSTLTHGHQLTDLKTSVFSSNTQVSIKETYQ